MVLCSEVLRTHWKNVEELWKHFGEGKRYRGSHFRRQNSTGLMHRDMKPHNKFDATDCSTWYKTEWLDWKWDRKSKCSPGYIEAFARGRSLENFLKTLCHPIHAILNLTNCTLAILSSFSSPNCTKLKQKRWVSENWVNRRKLTQVSYRRKSSRKGRARLNEIRWNKVIHRFPDVHSSLNVSEKFLWYS